METSLNIHYLLIGDLASKNILYEIESSQNNTSTHAKDIFNRMSILKNTNSNLINQRNKIPSANTTKKTFYYFYITENFIFIFLECDNNQHTMAFGFIETIVAENIHLMTNDRDSLNNNGKNKIQNLLTKYQKPTLVTTITDQDDVQLNVKDIGMFQTVENSNPRPELKLTISQDTKKKRECVKSTKNQCTKNWKIILIIVIIIIVLLVVIIVPIVLSRIVASMTN
jgi:hypothetical protein